MQVKFEIILKSLNCSAGKNKQYSPLIAHQSLVLNHPSCNSRKVRKSICHSPGWHLNLTNPLEIQPIDALHLPSCSAIDSPLPWNPQWKCVTLRPLFISVFLYTSSLFIFFLELNQLLYQRMRALCWGRVGYNEK